MSTAEQTVCVSLGPRTYEILIGPGLLARTADVVWRWHVQHVGKPPAQPGALIVTDTNVAPLHAEAVRRSLQAANWDVDVIALPAGEPSKSLDVVNTVYDRLIQRQADRRTVNVALTAEGLRAFETMAEGHEAEVARLFAGLSEDDLDQMTTILKRMGR